MHSIWQNHSNPPLPTSQKSHLRLPSWFFGIHKRWSSSFGRFLSSKLDKCRLAAALEHSPVTEWLGDKNHSDSFWLVKKEKYGKILRLPKISKMKNVFCVILLSSGILVGDFSQRRKTEPSTEPKREFFVDRINNYWRLNHRGFPDVQISTKSLGLLMTLNLWRFRANKLPRYIFKDPFNLPGFLLASAAGLCSTKQQHAISICF